MKHLIVYSNATRRPMKIEFTSRAFSRLEAIADYIDERSGNAQKAKDYVIQLREFIRNTLNSFPYAGRPCPDYGSKTRKLVYRGYSILYRIDGKWILILTIFRENLP